MGKKLKTKVAASAPTSSTTLSKTEEEENMDPQAEERKSSKILDVSKPCAIHLHRLNISKMMKINNKCYVKLRRLSDPNQLLKKCKQCYVRIPRMSALTLKEISH